MKFYLSKKISIIGVICTALMLRAAYWQWERYHWKLDLIEKLKSNVESNPITFSDAITLYTANDLDGLIHRRITLEGEYDFSHETVLRNRRYKDEPGVFVITPLKISNSESYVLVNRGFLPLSQSTQENRTIYQRPKDVSLIGLIKESSPKKFLAPADNPTGQNKPWVDSWIRVDIDKMSEQLPYKVAPFYIEIMSVNGVISQELNEVSTKIQDSRAGREEMFFLPGKAQVTFQTQFKDEELPIPLFDTVIPPGRHYGYIFEWAIMAAATLLITLALQLRKPRRKNFS